MPRGVLRVSLFWAPRTWAGHKKGQSASETTSQFSPGDARPKTVFSWRVGVFSKRVMKTIIVCFTILAAICGSNEGFAQQSSIDAGREIAQKFCATCHAIGPSGDSSHRDAPPFRQISLSRNSPELRRLLGEGLVVGHPSMPQWQFRPQDTNALIDYIRSLGGKG
jgi:cytochrome c